MHRVKDSNLLVEAFDVDRIYLRHKNQGLAPDYRVRIITCKNNTSSLNNSEFMTVFRDSCMKLTIKQKKQNKLRGL
jgi:hypothetical protein